jgi:hypothetical protein
MNKIKTVKIKEEDGSISEKSYTIAADAINIDMSNGENLQDTVGNINIDEDGNIAKQLNNIHNNLSSLNDFYKNSSIGKIIFGKNFDNHTKSGDFCFIKTPSKIAMIDTERSAN